MMGYNIEFYPYLPKILKYFFLHFDFRSDPDPEFFFELSRIRIRGKKIRILIPACSIHVVVVSCMKRALSSADPIEPA